MRTQLGILHRVPLLARPAVLRGKAKRASHCWTSSSGTRKESTSNSAFRLHSAFLPRRLGGRGRYAGPAELAVVHAARRGGVAGLRPAAVASVVYWRSRHARWVRAGIISLVGAQLAGDRTFRADDAASGSQLVRWLEPNGRWQQQHGVRAGVRGGVSCRVRCARPATGRFARISPRSGVSSGRDRLGRCSSATGNAARRH